MLMQSTMSTPDEIAACGRVRRTRLRLERETDLQIERTRLEHDRREIGTSLVVDGDAVPAGSLDLGEVLLGRLRHEMTVDVTVARVDDRRDPLEDDRADRDRLDEVAVADVEVEDARARPQQHLDLLAETREVGRVERRLDFHRSDPVVPAHLGASLGCCRRAMKKPVVPCTCGCVSRNSGRRGCRNCGQSSPSGSTWSPEASTMSSFSSRVER